MDWVNLLLLLLLCAGHAEVLAAAVNRLHARPFGERRLKQFRRVYTIVLLAFPVALLWFVGLRGPALLRGGEWRDVPVGWTLYLAACAVGATSLLIAGLSRALRKVPQWQVSNHSRTIDISQRLGSPPVGSGPYRLLAQIPFNEVFQVEVSEKHYRLPRLPRELDGLSILHLSDLHFRGTPGLPYFEQVIELASELRCDMIAFAGDLLDNPKLIQWLPNTLGRLSAPLGCYFILGNHDWYLDPAAIRAAVRDLGWQDVAGKTVEIEHRGQWLVIGGTELPWMGKHPDFSTAPADAFRILVSHTPDNIAYARSQNVDLMLSGHNHGGQVQLPLIGPVFAPSRFGVRYAGGVFEHEPTLLYVSRGISGRRPLRWNCLPELTKLVLHAG
ncbi:MAG: metallophosphoesterase [Planctomycetaceae bacterium]